MMRIEMWFRRMWCRFFGYDDVRLFLVPGSTTRYTCLCRSCGEFWQKGG